MKKSVTVIISAFALLLTFSLGAFAATKYNFTFDGKKQSMDVRIIEKQAYVPLNSVVKLYGGKVAYDNKTKTYAVTKNTANTTATQSSNTKTIDGVTIKLDKVVQDSDSLKIYVTYINKSINKL